MQHHCFSLSILLGRGNITCAGRPGSLGYEKQDANTYAAWNVDYLKLDTCSTNGTPALVEYSIMRDALNATGRPIFYSLCGIQYISNCQEFFLILFHLFSIKGGVSPTDMWPPSVGNSWRTTTDIQDYWSAIISNIDYVRLY